MKRKCSSLVMAVFIILFIHTRLSIAQTEWVNIYGTVTYNGTPLCAMVLANGQHMFTCGDDLGLYDLEVEILVLHLVPPKILCIEKRRNNGERKNE